MTGLQATSATPGVGPLATRWLGRTRPPWGVGLAALAMLAVLGTSVLALLALGRAGEGGAAARLFEDPWFWRVLRFSFVQAVLSTVLSLALALPLARVLALDNGLPGRAAFLRLCLLCFVMPSLVLVTGLVAVFGRSGWLGQWLGDGWQLYGLGGILLAHVYLNAPFALRVLAQRWDAIPSDAWKLAAQLRLSRWARFRHVEWPALRGVLPALAGLIFLLCFNSFAVVLTLGGGPAATTLEVAIYQALKFDFNPPEAMALAGLQLCVAGGLFALFAYWGRVPLALTPLGSDGWKPANTPMQGLIGRMMLALFSVFLLLPIIALLPTALQAGVRLPWAGIAQAGGVSLLLALAAALLAMWLAASALVLWWRVRRPGVRRLIEALAVHQLVIPGMVLSVGVYILLMPVLDWRSWGWLAVIGLNALIALPFVFAQLRPAVIEYESSYRPLLDDLGVRGWLHLRVVLWPYVRPLAGKVFAIALVLALGDFAVFGIFGHEGWPTLPWMIHALAGSYQLAEAAAASLLLLALALLCLIVLERSRA